jgi:DNA adenine methylase
MDPIIKWPGGKSRELPIIKGLIPAYARFVEPFAGGAAVYLSEEPSDGILNDLDTDLIALYRLVAAGSPATDRAFLSLADAWDAVSGTAQTLGPALRAKYRSGTLDTDAEALAWVAQMQSLTPNAFITAPRLLLLAQRSLASKAQRLRKLESGGPMSDSDLDAQMATGLIAGFYTTVRDGFVPPDLDHATAAYWFLREMCYGSMFRFNKAGQFNIPYGGASYNRKDLRLKISNLLGPKSRSIFSSAQIERLDFRAFFAAYGVGRPDDFVFLDPPYDSEFSDYGNNAFGRREQEDLAAIVAGLSSQVMMVVKNTPLIQDLYLLIASNHPRFTVGAYSQKYGYNVRGRNERGVEHLMITNYPLPIDAAEDLAIAA